MEIISQRQIRARKVHKDAEEEEAIEAECEVIEFQQRKMLMAKNR